ncbi:putative sporulation protein YyaC [Peribacillus simplex]|uniref:Sporulation protein YyaC n=1 Tax=Peribacillus simplex TaxID=1478 RepID=A0A9X8R1T4_9BACI|nr:spore protease YyaC [Peribacillus simplex]SIQ05970.1 putative sporulation protein YyaC [Peribacillus simplex]
MYPFNGRKKGETKKEMQYCNYTLETEAEGDIDEMSFQIARILRATSKEIIFLCIGSERSTGDSFGPLVGTMLREKQVPYHVFGTLADPVHALNLKSVLKEIKKQFNNPFIFGIDACLGGYHQIGSIFLTEGPFSPGEAMNKSLPELGDYHLKAVVNYLDPPFPQQSLNDTSLDTIMNLAKITTRIIVKTV